LVDVAEPELRSCRAPLYRGTGDRRGPQGLAVIRENDDMINLYYVRGSLYTNPRADLFVRASTPHEAVTHWQQYYDADGLPDQVDEIPVAPAEGAILWEDIPCVWAAPKPHKILPAAFADFLATRSTADVADEPRQPHEASVPSDAPATEEYSYEWEGEIRWIRCEDGEYVFEWSHPVTRLSPTLAEAEAALFDDLKADKP
jgi:hypothetical protein